MTDGLIELDSSRAMPFGFTSDRFAHGSYLWKLGDRVVISLITSLRRGNFRKLVAAILSYGFSVEVPTPLGRMADIVRKCGYRQTWRFVAGFGELVEVWVLDDA